MDMRRLILVVLAVVTVTGGSLLLGGWHQAVVVAPLMAALGTIVMMMRALWSGSAKRTAPGGPERAASPEREVGIRVRETGAARSGPGGVAISGLVMDPSAHLPGTVEVERTGDADAVDGGISATGLDLGSRNRGGAAPGLPEQGTGSVAGAGR